RMGLRADIAHVVTSQTIANFGDLVQKSYHAEAGLEEIRRERGEALKKKDHGKFSSHLKPKGSPSKGKQQYSPRSPRVCDECGFPHAGECLRGKGVCYHCKQPGHMKHECPELKKQSGGSGTNRSKGRVYTLDATNSFISVECVKRLNLQSSPLIPPMTVSVAT
ncbi:gag protease polyprotein, partial [Trifolium medium]|nr:gag protease polyprotein [Trifolium medium]